MTDLTRLLRERGPSLTSDLAACLRNAGLSPEAARQRLSRRPEEIRVLYGLPFPKRARFIYLEGRFGTADYWGNLRAAVEKANPAYAAALFGLRSRGGVVPAKHFDVISGAPVAQKGQLSAATILDRLCSVRLASRIDLNGIGDCVLLDGAVPTPATISKLRARLRTEGVLLDAIRTWAGRMNLASPGVIRIRDEEPKPQFSTCRFDLTGPSYLRPLTRSFGTTVVPGFLVADVLCGHGRDEQEVQPFLRKCAALEHLRKVRPFLPMLIADGFTPEALRACRSRGIVATRPDTIFGQDVARALGDLLQTLSNAAEIAAGNPEKIASLIGRLSAIEGAAGNLRGALFELIVGHMVRSVEGGWIDIGILADDPMSGKRAEIDVRLARERQVAVYECKGYQPSSVVRAAEVSEWLEQRIPVIDSACRCERRFESTSMKFEFSTWGSFEDEALRVLDLARKRTRKYAIDWKDGSAVREYAQDIIAPGIRKVLDEHYFNHLLAKMPRASGGGKPSKDDNLPIDDINFDEGFILKTMPSVKV